MHALHKRLMRNMSDEDGAMPLAERNSKLVFMDLGTELTCFKVTDSFSYSYNGCSQLTVSIM
jgi:hypothetical protein